MLTMILLLSVFSLSIFAMVLCKSYKNKWQKKIKYLEGFATENKFDDGDNPHRIGELKYSMGLYDQW